jgi:hypothetical protein
MHTHTVRIRAKSQHPRLTTKNDRGESDRNISRAKGMYEYILLGTKRAFFGESSKTNAKVFGT